MKLTVPAITHPEVHVQGSAQTTSDLLEQIDALLAQGLSFDDSSNRATREGAGTPPRPRPFRPAA